MAGGAVLIVSGIAMFMIGEIPSTRASTALINGDVLVTSGGADMVQLTPNITIIIQRSRKLL